MEQQKTNAFGHKIYPISETLQDKEVHDLICDVTNFHTTVVTGLDKKIQIARFLDSILELTNEINPAKQVRESALEIMGGEEGMKKVREIRIKDIITDFKSYIENSQYSIRGDLLDLGCGNGLIIKSLYNPRIKSVELADVMNYTDPSVNDWKFVEIQKSGRLPYKDNTFDSILVITVLHHSSNPKELLREIIRICKGRIYIMESLVGINANMRTTEHESGTDREKLFELEKRFSSMNEEKQIMYTSFFDWFYNDVVQGDVDVPLNFAADKQWFDLFIEYGLNPVARHMLGFDQKTSGVYHAIYVCEKK